MRDRDNGSGGSNAAGATALPIDGVLDELAAAVADRGLCVLEAPPGAGKTTRVPLHLLSRIAGRIVMLEPRRIAARAAAERMAETLGEPVGRTVGYRIRGEAKVSRETRIEVVTEGVLTRRLQSDPPPDPDQGQIGPPADYSASDDRAQRCAIHRPVRARPALRPRSSRAAPAAASGQYRARC